MVVTEKQLEDRLEEELSGWKQLVILGVGNELGGDDSLGLLAARKLKEALSGISGVDVLAVGNAPENFTGLVRRLSPSHILLIDAAEMGEPAGTIKLVEAHQIEGMIPSTHSLSLNMLVSYLEQELGSKVLILGMQPKRLYFGTTLSEEVEGSVGNLTYLLEQIIASSPERWEEEKEMTTKQNMSEVII